MMEGNDYDYDNGHLRHGHFIMTNQAMMATVKLAQYWIKL